MSEPEDFGVTTMPARFVAVGDLAAWRPWSLELLLGA